MRKSLVIFSLVALALAATATEAFAQRVRVNTGRGGISIGVGSGSGYYGNGYYGNSYYGSPYYGNRGYYYGNSYSPGYYYSTPNYYVEPSTVVVPTEARPSYYVDPGSANVSVMLPSADAEVWFDNAPTRQRGMERIFHTPSLQPGSYTYSIRARWNDNGRTVDQTRQVQVRPGQSVTVDFRNSAELLPTPRNPE